MVRLDESDNIHVIELAGKTRVVIKNGKVIEVGEPIVKSCPLWRDYFGLEEFTKEFIHDRVQRIMIDKRGLFTERRSFELLPEVDFGVSEIMMNGCEDGLLDVAVEVSDCAGTVIVPDPELIEGIAGQIPGVIRASPIKKVIDELEARGALVLDPATAKIDQVEGVRRAIELGYRKIGVSVIDAGDAKRIREIERDTGVHVVIFAVHTTGLNREEVEEMVAHVDVITACASETIREFAGKHALVQIGVKIPLFALTFRGKELVLNRAKHVSKKLIIQGSDLPVRSHEEPHPLSE
ncbi:MAG: methanogenesis marker protein 8 [Candidatus Syntrophoarchaeum butanivorans]|uniref:Methanogenesis marker protein 8 n=1 Tax=Candidatus Syntropharchaeum butanivorans TaxID=1839936 RepID=A0A1F2P597_9EURY|nr:MAG: methanogenesis marker protein 8 [Candidatus Syntrophoarchaeum butanivorans]